MDNFNHIAFFFKIFESYKCNKLYEITPNERFSWEPKKTTLKKKQISQNEILHMTILTVFSQFLWHLKFIFSGSYENLFLELFDIHITYCIKI